jgi:hypothetical protein
VVWWCCIFNKRLFVNAMCVPIKNQPYLSHILRLVRYPETTNMGKGPKKPGVTLAGKGKKYKICSHDIIKKSCRICSPHLYCNCGVMIKNCMKCKQYSRNRKCCDRARSMCSLHGGTSTHPISHCLTHNKY